MLNHSQSHSKKKYRGGVERYEKSLQVGANGQKRKKKRNPKYTKKFEISTLSYQEMFKLPVFFAIQSISD